MKYRQLGATGITVSEVGFGANTVSGVGTYGSVDEADGIAAIKRAYELGVTFYDTAEGYSEGRSETVIGKVIGDRKDVVICTKVGGRARKLTPSVIREAAEGSLKRLKRDVIDVYLLHNPSDEQVADPGYITAMESLKRDGLIRTYGISLSLETQIDQGKTALALGGYQAFEVEFNLVLQDPADELLPQSFDQGAGVIVRVPLASGLLSGKYNKDAAFAANDRRSLTMPKEQMTKAYKIVDAVGPIATEGKFPLAQAAIAWILTHKEVSTVIPGCKNTTQVEQNVAASEINLPPSLMAAAKTFR